jgi:indole-3-glycerol phosphate synthase
MKPLIIAEVKTASPFGYKSSKSWDELFKIAERVGDIISVHTDPRWDGSFDLIKKARSLTDKRILAKGIHEDDSQVQQAIDCGADFVLIVGRIPNVHADKCFIEPNTIDELKTYPKNTYVVWNSRDLSTGGLKKETFEEARAAFGGWMCQASNIRTRKDISNKTDAVLVGTHLEEFANINWLN